MWMGLVGGKKGIVRTGAISHPNTSGSSGQPTVGMASMETKTDKMNWRAYLLHGRSASWNWLAFFPSVGSLLDTSPSSLVGLLGCLRLLRLSFGSVERGERGKRREAGVSSLFSPFLSSRRSAGRCLIGLINISPRTCSSAQWAARTNSAKAASTKARTNGRKYMKRQFQEARRQKLLRQQERRRCNKSARPGKREQGRKHTRTRTQWALPCGAAGGKVKWECAFLGSNGNPGAKQLGGGRLCVGISRSCPSFRQVCLLTFGMMCGGFIKDR